MTADEPVRRWRCTSYCLCTPMTEQHGHFEQNRLGVWVLHTDVERMEREIERLRAALDSFVKIADETATQWDNDNDARVGKMLLAMAGRVPRYRADIDAIHALRRRTVDVPAPQTCGCVKSCEPESLQAGETCVNTLEKNR